MSGAAPPDGAVRLTSAERERLWPNQRPRDAATLILIDRSGSVPKVLMGRRHHGHRFMPGKFVFPGGRVDACDRTMPAAGALLAPVEAKLMARVQRPSAQRARALALAAIRETFEETGLAIGTREYGAPENCPEGSWRDFAGLGVFPALESVWMVARAITPPRRPKRFDTRFFAAEATDVAARREGVVGPDSELVELVWITLDEARTLDLPTITGVILDELSARLAAGLGPDAPAPFYREVRGTFLREEV